MFLKSGQPCEALYTHDSRANIHTPFAFPREIFGPLLLERNALQQVEHAWEDRIIIFVIKSYLPVVSFKRHYFSKFMTKKTAQTKRKNLEQIFMPPLIFFVEHSVE